MITAADLTGGAGKPERVVVTRPFLLRGERQEVGTVLTLPRALAAELRAANKAERAPDPTPEPQTQPQSPGLTGGTAAPAEPVETPKRASAKKESGHAGQ